MAQELPPHAPYAERFLANKPAATNAQEAATRVYSTGGVLRRSDPFAAAADRNGKTFARTEWFDPNSKPPQPQQTLMQGTAPQEPQDPITRFRNKVIQRIGAGGIHAIGRSFRIMDDDRSGRLNEDELQTGLKDYGLHMDMAEIKELMQAIGNGRPVCYDDFLLAVRGTINKRRQGMIDMAYKVLDNTGDGKITIEDIQNRYNVHHDPDVLAGRKVHDCALGDFLGQFDSIDKDGTVTMKEFTEYYRNVSASVDDDDYFELMMRNAWHIPGGSGWCENTANTRLLVVTSKGEQKVVEVMNDLGLDFTDHAAVMKQLRAQGLTDVVKFSRSAVI